MAAVETSNLEQLTTTVGSPQCPDGSKEVPVENVMETLRAKESHFKSWGEIAKALRLSVMDKRHIIDNVERVHLQKILDTLQKSIKVSSLQSMVERLDSITRQQGLKFTFGPSNTECYISSDMFYVEILLEPTGEVIDVKIAHHGDPVSCPELTEVLRNGNFAEFTKHLEGLSSIYQLNADKKQKTKAYLALQALEIDLSMLAQLQSSINDPSNLVHKSPVGILQPRQGGYPQKLTYFISPYDLLDVETKSSIPLTVDAVIEKGLGHSVTVCIESSTAHKLQTVSLISVSKTPEGKSLPSFAALSNLNSTNLPASFVLKLPVPIPMASNIIKKIQIVTKKTDWVDLTASQPLLSVIISDTSKGKLLQTSKGLHVTLPDQHHCYILNSNSDLQGVLVNSIPFSHPTHVPQILVFLRQQMLFNSVISSCVRPDSKKDVDSPFMFELVAYSTSHITVHFDHPLEESLASIDLDLKDITNVKCKIFTLSSDAPLCTDEYASKIMQRCLSIPVTMRAVIRKAQGQQQQMKSSNQGDMYCAAVTSGSNVPYLSHIPNYGNSLTNGSSFTGGDFSNLASRMCHKPSDSSDQSNISKALSQNIEISQSTNNLALQGPDISNNQSINADVHAPHMAITQSDTSAAGIERMRNPSGSKNQPLGSFLSQNQNSQSQYQQNKHANTMLMSMLSDVPSANPSSSSFPFLVQNTNNDVNIKQRKQRKRKATSDSRSPGSSGRSPKRKLSEDDSVKDQTFDPGSPNSQSSNFDSSSNIAVSVPSSTSDQTHLNKTATFDTFIKSEPQSHGYPQRSSSTDSYLASEHFQALQSINVNESSRLSEGGTPSTRETFCSIPQIKNHYIKSEPMLDFDEDVASNSGANYSQNISNINDIDEESSFNIDTNQTNSRKTNCEKPSKKTKRSKDQIDSKLESQDSITVKIRDYNSSEESSLDDVSQKSCSEAENSQTEDNNIGQKSTSSHTSQPIIFSTSLKIAKSGDSHKISKSEIKIKQKEGKRSLNSGDTSEGNSGKKKNEGKKERKRRRVENADSGSSRSPVRSFQVNIDSSLMPPPASTTESTYCVVSTSDTVPIRPLMLNVKNSSSSSGSKSPLPSKKVNSGSSSPGNNSSKIIQSSKNSSEKLVVKPPPPHSTHFVAKGANSDPEISTSTLTKVTIPTSVKIIGKHKQSSSSKNNPSGSSTSLSHVSSQNKTNKATLKLKNLNLPSSTTITPVVNKSVSPTSTHSSGTTTGVSVVSSSAVSPTSPPSKQGSNSAKANKAALRSRKGSLNSVIDKLMVTATNAQHVPIGMENIKSEGNGSRSDTSGDRRESKSERKESSKEMREGMSSSKGNENKPKYSSSDQFTVKQSSQGIKLTVTKTRASDGPKMGKSRSIASKSSLSGGALNMGKTGSSINSLPSKTSSSASKKASFQTATTTAPSVSPKTPISNCPNKSVTVVSQKNIVASNPSITTATKTGNSASGTSVSNVSKSVSKFTSSSSVNKVTSTKVLEKIEKKNILEGKQIQLNEAKEKVLLNLTNAVSNLMPPPSSKTVNDGRASGGNTPKRTEESPIRHSPRHTPTQEIIAEESEGEKAFRLLLAQTKAEGQNGAEQNLPVTKSLDLALGPLDCTKVDSVMKIEPEDNLHWVSSTTDIKSVISRSSNLKLNQNQIIVTSNENIIDTKQVTPLEVSSCIIQDNMINTDVVSSSEEVKIVSPFTKPVKQTKRINTHSDDDSSPEDGLVIDYPDTPRVQRSPDKKWSSPRIESNICINVIDEKSEKSDASPGNFAGKSPFARSPLKSPAQVITPPSNHSLSSSLSRPSPCVIDDELMDEALMTIGK